MEQPENNGQGDLPLDFIAGANAPEAPLPPDSQPRVNAAGNGVRAASAALPPSRPGPASNRGQNVAAAPHKTVKNLPGQPAGSARPAPPVPAFGRYLREARERAGLTIAQVDDATKIRGCYIESMESEDFSNLPPAVYIIAYARKLSNFYRIAPEVVEQMVEELRQHLEYTLPEEFINRLDVDREGCEENEQKLRHLLWILGSAVGIFVVLVVLTILFFIAPRRSQPAEPENPAATVTVSPPAGEAAAAFDDNKLYELIDPPQLEISELPVDR
ncbi:RodZ family helix-turn-helix domain-containing protein [Victivallis sp. Marseille-Q1083]|uniref:helix-turn-helix domain-containing protein n=1 Tax=Victivallis sp. Marseille-Q1083 TaxID=2717288 RepID=UPI001588425A|nr:helix-turn-helix domain-containing protein [Victivallis sp. Marseille-Q1083]